jgi:hypothetical protein
MPRPLRTSWISGPSSPVRPEPKRRLQTWKHHVNRSDRLPVESCGCGAHRIQPIAPLRRPLRRSPLECLRRLPSQDRQSDGHERPQRHARRSASWSTAPFVVVVAVIASIAGCVAASSPSHPSADPYAGLPSNACGGFHLKLVNQIAASARVALNGASATEVPAGTTLTINEHVSTPQPPPLPWRVVITDVTTGTELFSATMTGPVDQKVVLSSGAPAQTAYDLQSEGC